MSHLSPQKLTFSSQLDKHITESGYSVSQVARLSDVSKRTLANWVSGHVKKPRHGDDLLRICQTLHLSPQQTQELFDAAGLSAPEGIVSEKPFHIGPDLPYFVGRNDQINRIRQDVEARTLSFAYALIGMAGVGKTTLAWHLAHLLKGYFPDGVLWAQVDSAGAAETALTSFALSFGLDVTELPDIESKSRQWRTVLNNRRTIIILDNVMQFSDIEHIVPANGDNLVLITTRQQGCGMLQGVEQIPLQPFTDEAWDVIAHFLSEERIRSEKGDLARLIAQLGGLPLALTIVLSRLAIDPHRTVAQVLEELESLRAIKTDDVSVEHVFMMSYQRLSDVSQLVMAVTGLFHREGIRAEAVANVLDMPLTDTRDTLYELYRASLIQHGQQHAYRLHPLIAQFARTRSPARTLQLRFVDYYVGYIEQHYHDYAAIDKQAEHILAMFEVALAHRAIEPMVIAISYFFRYLEDRDLLRRIVDPLQRLYDILHDMTDPDSLAKVTYYYGRLQRRLGDMAAGQSLTKEALQLGIATDQVRVILLCHNSLGIHAADAGDYDGALSHFEAAREIIYAHELFGYRYSNLVNTASIYYQQERYDDARETVSQVLDFVTDVEREPDSVRITVGYVYALLRDISSSTGNHEAKLRYQKLGLSLARDLNNQRLLAEFSLR